jgi:hypothetical protein
MVAFQFRMGAGFPGDVNRSHPASIEAAITDPTNPPMAFGQAVLVNPASQGVRSILTSDGAIDAIYGITVRPYPAQPATASGAYGAQGIGAAPLPPNQPVDVLRSGYILAPVNGTPSKGGRVFIWTAASTGPHVTGGFEAAATAGSTIELDEKSYYNGTPDASGTVEISFNI